ncbi:phenylalanine--tRNA ligase subunit beta [Gammaproteobacteria bacterium]|nr:phenylalanine--tRNA ligase subunit beta [Gammaproteobacteria bacterium]
MKLSYIDLLRFIVDIPSIEELSDKLFQLGHEHEIENHIFDMELTPNRGDCLSLVGLARDLNAFYNTNLSVETYEEKINPLDLDFINLSPNDCPKISFLELEVEDLPDKYHDYLESFFKDLQVGKNNFFTDISNYISYELGQPTHCFDKSKLNGHISFESKECDSPFTTLLDTDIQLKGKNCVFLNNNEVISLAGVMGGKSTACSKDTKKVLIECAYFNPESIIGKSIQYNLHSDAAHKFERGVDINSHEMVLRRFIKIVEQHVKIKDCKVTSFESKAIINKDLPISLNKINAILGTSISSDTFKNILIKLGFNITTKIKPPSYRSDITSQNDLAEEVARVIGYNNIPSQTIAIPRIEKNNNKLNLESLKSGLKNKGFYEVINFPFTSIEKENSITLDNPLDSNKKNLRIALKESLIENLLYNERRQKDSIKLFEISDTYYKNNNLEQSLKLGIIASGRVGHNYNNFSKKIDEAFLLDVFKSIFGDKDIAIEQISRNNLNTKIKNNIFYIEISLDKLQSINVNVFNEEHHMEFKKYTPISEFPSSSKDFSFLIADYSKYNEVIEMTNKIQGMYLKDFFIFDFYKNNKNEEIKIGVRMIFQSNEKTLSDEDIKDSISKILQPFLDIEGVSIPGM